MFVLGLPLFAVGLFASLAERAEFSFLAMFVNVCVNRNCGHFSIAYWPLLIKSDRKLATLLFQNIALIIFSLFIHHLS